MTCVNLVPIEMKTKNKFNVKFIWRNPDGTAKDISGGTVTAIAKKSDGSTVALSTEIQDAENGVQWVRYEDLSLAVWTIQIALLLDGDHQSYNHRVTVGRSFEE